MRDFRYLVVVAISALLLSSCAGKKNVVQEDDVEKQQTAVTSDVTTPPNSLENSVEAIEESNPDETISFEEWKQKKSREQETETKPE